MKYSGYAPEEQLGLRTYIDKRWGQLAVAHDQSVADTSKYIFLVNSGAAVATLTFIGTVARVREQLWPTWMLMMFVLGVILVGISHLARSWELDQLYEGFRKDVSKFYADQMCFEDVLLEDSRKCDEPSYGVRIRNLAFAAFLVGVVIGAVNFNSIAKGDQHVGQKQTTTNKAVAAKPAAPNSSTEGRREQSDARRGENPAPIRPAPASAGPEKIIPNNRESP
jgi:hypothetical protein